MEPNWGNTHAPTCSVTKGREELWADFCRSLHLPGKPNEEAFMAAMDRRDYLWGAVIEYSAGGDEDREVCDCKLYNPSPSTSTEPLETRLTLGRMPSESLQALQLALSIETFLRETKPTREAPPAPTMGKYNDIQKGLLYLADLWDRG